MKKRKMVAATLALLLLLQLLTGCAREHVYFYGNAGKWINEEFAENNLLRFDCKDCPSDRTFVVKNQEEYDQIFKKDITKLSVDFTHEMIVVYTFTDDDRYKNVLVEVNEEDGGLSFVCNDDIPPSPEGSEPSGGGCCNPYQRWYVIKLGKRDVQSVAFEFEWKK